MVRSVLMLGGVALLALGPIASQAGDRYGPRPAGDEAYAYRRAAGSAASQTYERREQAGTCGGEARLAPDGYVYVCPNARLRDEADARYETREVYDRRDEAGWSRTDRFEDERFETAYRHDQEDDSSWEERRRDDDRWEGDRWDEREGRWACEPHHGERGRPAESCGEIRLSDSFFWGGGGVGPEYIDAGGGGGGGVVYAGAGASSSATAIASARASVGVNIRIGGGGKRGHGGKPGHPPGGGGSCCKGH